MVTAELSSSSAADAPPLTIPSALARSALENPLAPALTDGLLHLTYRRLQGEVADISRALAPLVRPGDRVALQLPRCAEYVVLYLACLSLGAAVVPLSYDLSASERDGELAACTPVLLLHDSRVRGDHAGRGGRTGRAGRGRHAAGGVRGVPIPAPVSVPAPVNHLDDRAADWLTDWLRRYRGPCVIASHDRALPTDAGTAIVDLDGPRGGVARYGGGDEDYLAERRAARDRWERQYARWREETERVRARLAPAASSDDGGGLKRDNEKMGYDRTGGKVQAAVARRTRAARLELRRLLDDPVPPPPEPLRFRARPGAEETGRTPHHERSPTAPAAAPQANRLPTAPLPAAPPLLRASGVAFGEVLRGIHVELRPGDFMVVVGPNGVGKSTLLRVLAGALAPDHGTVALEDGVRVGYLPQETEYAEEGHRGVLEVYARRRALDHETAHAELGRFGLFRRGDLAVPVNRLSTGQRRRLSIAELFAARPDLLLLDEPTNHLSLPLVEQLQRAIEEFAGPKVLVTHDRTMRARYADHVVELTDGALRRPR